VFGQVSNPPSVDDMFSADPYANRFLYTGREFLKEANLYDYRNRVYSAELGRFIQSDPIRFDAGDGNLYRYVFNSSILFKDNFGLEVICATLKTWETDNKYHESTYSILRDTVVLNRWVTQEGNRITYWVTTTLYRKDYDDYLQISRTYTLNIKEICFDSECPEKGQWIQERQEANQYELISDDKVGGHSEYYESRSGGIPLLGPGSPYGTAPPKKIR
jgi:RHS repeat-associated protein